MSNTINNMVAENIRLKQRITQLEQKLYPAPQPMRTIKYWIVTWLDDGLPMATACGKYVNALSLVADLKINHAVINIFEQTVFAP